MREIRHIGIYGGTFNPIHNGHIRLARAAKDNFDLDKVLFVPNFIPPHKEYDDFKDSNIHRINMVKLAIKDYEGFEYSDIEQKAESISYTYETLIKLDELLGDEKLYFIIGDDSFFKFHTWVHPEIISKYASLLVGKRENVPNDKYIKQKAFLEDKFNTKIDFIDNKIIEISSTDIRTHNYEISHLKEILPSDVLKYIIDNNLYNY